MNITSVNSSEQNHTLTPNLRGQGQDQMTIVSGVFLGFTAVGLVGNIIVFWYLCFKIQRNKYTVYIMNLAGADSILQIVAIITLMININTFKGSNSNFHGKEPFVLFLTIVYYAMIFTGMYLLTAISTERCGSVLFPIWNSVHRPRNLSTIMCCSAWALGTLESLVDNFVCQSPLFSKVNCLAIGVINFVLAVGICLPLMIVSSLILLIKIRKTFRQRYPPKLYIIIIIAAIMFTLSVLPLNTVRFLISCNLIPLNVVPFSIITPSEYWMIINSAINPYVYFLVGRRWNQRTCFSIKDTLHRAFTLDTAE